jgi:hypothetical protein
MHYIAIHAASCIVESALTVDVCLSNTVSLLPK